MLSYFWTSPLTVTAVIQKVIQLLHAWWIAVFISDRVFKFHCYLAQEEETPGASTVRARRVLKPAKTPKQTKVAGLSKPAKVNGKVRNLHKIMQHKHSTHHNITIALLQVATPVRADTGRRKWSLVSRLDLVSSSTCYLAQHIVFHCRCQWRCAWRLQLQGRVVSDVWEDMKMLMMNMSNEN